MQASGLCFLWFCVTAHLSCDQAIPNFCLSFLTLVYCKGMNLGEKPISIIIYCSAAAFVALLYILVTAALPSADLQRIRLTEYYALTTITVLYATLLLNAAYGIFPQLPGQALFYKARKPLGLSVFGLALLHANFGFFGLLGGFSGLAFLSETYRTAITLAASALVIFGFLAVLSLFSTWAERNRWVYGLVYIAALLIAIHALALGSHFADLSNTIPQLFIFGLLLLLILEALRLDKFVSTKWPSRYQFGWVFALCLVIITFYTQQYVIGFDPSTGSFGLHAQHLQQAQNNTGGVQSRYSVSLEAPQNVIPGQPVELRFKVFNASSGEVVRQFILEQEKLMHLIIVNNGLSYFDHVHPELTGDSFVVTATFPSPDLYRLYLNFLPSGGQEQQIALSIPVGTTEPLTRPVTTPDLTLKTIGDYAVAIDTNGPLKASELSIDRSITFSLTKQGQELRTLEPYLGAFGHMVMVHTTTHEYAHVHPNLTDVLKPTDRGGPTVEFTPLALGNFQPFKPGVYQVFVQFQENSTLFVAPFRVEVQ